MSRTILFVLVALGVVSTASLAASMNPETSVNLLGGYSQAKRQGADKTEPGGGFSLQGVELQFKADVDPFLKATAIIGIHPEEPEAHAEGETHTEAEAEAEEHPEAEGEAEADAEDDAEAEAHDDHGPTYHVEPEEAYFETTRLPLVTVKAGKFKAALGRHNTLHAHAFPFVDAPLINETLLGHEGLADVGVSAALLIPAPWFLEITGQALQGNSEELFASESASDVAHVYRLRNLFELSDATTFDLGLSGAGGANEFNERTTVTGIDVSLKWRPTKGGKYSALILAGEHLQGNVEGREELAKTSGYAAWIQVQVAERWWVQARNEAIKVGDEGAEAKRNTGLVAFNPSEFSSFRLQLDRLDEGQGVKPLDTVQIQSNITIGAHPAHSY